MEREFDVNNYDEALSFAQSILSDSEAIYADFEDNDVETRRALEEKWQSMGASQSYDSYVASIKSKYEPFRAAVAQMKKHIDETIASYRAADAQATATVTQDM